MTLNVETYNVLVTSYALMNKITIASEFMELTVSNGGDSKQLNTSLPVHRAVMKDD